MRVSLLALAAVVLAGAWASETVAGAQRPTGGQDFGQIQAPRDTPAQSEGTAETATISGRVVDGKTGQPLKRARVSAASRGGQGGIASQARNRIGVQTDDAGRFVLADLPVGRYTLSVSKPGYITLGYGQRRPRQPATPVQVTAGQHLQNIDFNLPPGSVITGTLADEDGAPVPMAAVQVLRYVYRQGQQQLGAAGSDRTDDRGEYRVFSLEPGDYFVSAIVPRELRGGGTRGGGLASPVGGPDGGGFAGRFGDPTVGADPVLPGLDDPGELGYAPTYYPGVASLGEAARVTVGLSSEAAGVDFALRLVPTASVSGTIFDIDGTPAAGTQVMMMPAEGVVFRGAMLGARVRGDGTFEVRDVPPGQYALRAMTRGGRRGRGGGFGGGIGAAPSFASQSIAVDGFDITDVTLVLGPGATIRGSVVFDSTSQSPPDSASGVRISAPAVEPIPFGGSSNTRVESDGTFEMSNVSDGRRRITASGAPDGWILTSVYLDGRDVIDTPLDFGGVRRVDGVQLVFTDQVSELSGVVHDGQGAALTEFTVIAFPVNEQLWQPQSRYIKASRPDQNAHYRIEGLPAGEYLLAAVEVVQQGEWFDPRFLARLRPGAASLSIDAGESQELNLTLSPQPR